MVLLMEKEAFSLHARAASLSFLVSTTCRCLVLHALYIGVLALLVYIVSTFISWTTNSTRPLALLFLH